MNLYFIIMTMKQVKFVPQVLQWARERAKIDVAYLASKMKVANDNVIEWEMNGELSLARAKKLATYTRTPFGYLFTVN